jgi:peptidoglycan/LPS O-acetylase OafA/YrhL
MTKIDSTILKPKQHFEILDGLRGIAALSIVLFHFMEIVYQPAKILLRMVFLRLTFSFVCPDL